MIGEFPGEVARAANVPEGEDAADFAGVLGEDAERVCGEHLEGGGHEGVEELIYGLVVRVLRAGGVGSRGGLPGEGEKGE